MLCEWQIVACNWCTGHLRIRHERKISQDRDPQDVAAKDPDLCLVNEASEDHRRDDAGTTSQSQDHLHDVGGTSRGQDPHDVETSPDQDRLELVH